MAIEQRQTILNMYNSGIIPEVIALQMDKSKEEILQIIEKTKTEEEEKNKNKVGLSFSSSKVELRKDSSIPLISKVYIDKTVNIDHAIKHAQSRMWKALTVKSDFNISMEETQNALNNYAESKATFVILHIDLVDSTKLSMTLPVNRLVTIIQAFSQEMSVIVATYGGYVLKYIGDAVLAFFIVDSPNNLYLRCINALECACSMIKVVRQGINPILNQYDYPELKVRIGIDVGENAVVQFGWDTHTLDGKVITKSPHFDILGYTISIAAKMSALAKPNRIVIGQSVYEILDDNQKYAFEALPIRADVWSYVSSNTGGSYRIYESITE